MLGAYVQPETQWPQGLEYLRPLLRTARAGKQQTLIIKNIGEIRRSNAQRGPY